MSLVVYMDVNTFFVSVSLLVILFLSGLTPLKAEILSSLESEGLSFISQDYENTKTSQFGFIGANLRSYKSQEDIFKINMSGRYALGHPVLSSINFREIYFSLKLDETTSLHIGRKINIWAELDQDWHTGFFQPQFRWNTIDPQTQGLTGLFWEKKLSNMKMMLFGTPFFIPDQGPGYELKEGQFQSTNPWFQSPPQNVSFQNQELPIDYQVELPNLAEVIFQPGFGAQLSSISEDGYFFKFGGLYKPSNQLALGYDGVLVTDRVKITVHPETYMENVVHFDLGYLNEAHRLSLSTVYLRPQNPEFKSDVNAPIFEEAVSIQPKYEVRLSDSWQFDILGLWTEGGQVTEKGPDSDPERLPLSVKYLYKKAYQVSLKYTEVFFKKLKLSSELNWLESERKELQILRSMNTIDVKGPWKFKFNLILIETSDVATNVSYFRNLDQVWLGASYDF